MFEVGDKIKLENGTGTIIDKKILYLVHTDYGKTFLVDGNQYESYTKKSH